MHIAYNIVIYYSSEVFYCMGRVAVNPYQDFSEKLFWNIYSIPTLVITIRTNIFYRDIIINNDRLFQFHGI